MFHTKVTWFEGKHIRLEKKSLQIGAHLIIETYFF